MNFSEKLITLMNITGTSSKALANALHVDPSRISQLRTGRRKLPKHRESVDEMAHFFAMRCTSASQKLALSEVIGNPNIRRQNNPQLLSALITSWFYEDDAQAQYFLDVLSLSQPPVLSADAKAAAPDIGDCLTRIFHGSAGKRDAMLLTYQQIISLQEPETIYLSADEDIGWYMADPVFSQTLEQFRLACIQNGHHIVQIIDPSASSYQAFETLFQWLPGYTGGQVMPYYYPRIRDGIFRHTFLVVPGKTALFSESVGAHSESHFTLFSTDGQTTHAVANLFNDYLRLCYPVLQRHTAREDILQNFLQLLMLPARHLQLCDTLSPLSRPMELHKLFARNLADDVFSQIDSLVKDNREEILSNQLRYGTIDICPMATAEQVRAGIVHVSHFGGTDGQDLFYTAETYLIHLKYILHLMDTYENYHFIPIPYSANNSVSVLVQENLRALLLSGTSSQILFEIRQPAFIVLLQEYLFKISDKINYLGNGRLAIRRQIKELISNLETGSP